MCIDRAYRRKGLLRGLYQEQKRELAGRFEVGVALIARTNQHSLDAHVAGLGMTDVGSFEVNGNVFATVAFSPGAQVRRGSSIDSAACAFGLAPIESIRFRG